MHGYTDHFMLLLHRPLRGDGGHVHYLELDLLVRPNDLVTVHGPRNPVVPLVATLTSAEEMTVNELAEEVGGLEKRVMAHMDDNNPQAFLDELFMVRHVLVTVRTMASQSNEILSRCLRVLRHLPADDLEISRTCGTATGGWTASAPASSTS